ncbi:hypothetical protein FHW79_005437 [Azospirillum sp. OGB3]|uniref:hypothetical protein n=1 Tax=Azospirillum sp. OGB3 TaxID=2587012 RepID=UPI001606651A|nr:hypothetical protein [Azospirillum sp. OGB3]MBB3267772.1 hypothetical protein [Azospirillum sp. OGB3]
MFNIIVHVCLCASALTLLIASALVAPESVRVVAALISACMLWLSGVATGAAVIEYRFARRKAKVVKTRLGRIVHPIGLLLALAALGVVLATGAEASAIVSCLIFIAGSAALSAWNWGWFSR